MKLSTILLFTILFSHTTVSERVSETVVFQQGANDYVGCDDYELRNPLQHYENGPETDILKVSEHCSSCVIARTAITFDLTSIPPNAEVENATLALFPDFYDGGSKTGNYSVFQVAQPWKEDEVTWDQPADGLMWANPGGDFIAEPVTKITVPRPTEYAWVSFTVTSLVQRYIKMPTTNYGFLIINSLGAQGIYFMSSEHKQTTLRPKLTVTYNVDPSSVIGTTNHLSTLESLPAIHIIPSGIHLSNNTPVPQRVAITRPDGSVLQRTSVAPTRQHTFTNIPSGIYIVSWGQTSLVHHSVIPVPH